MEYAMDTMSQRMAQGGAMDADEQSASKMMEASAGGGGWKVDRVEIRPAENGGFIATCSKSRPPTGRSDGNGGAMVSGSDYQNKEYAFGSLGELAGFLEQEFGGDVTTDELAAKHLASAGPPMSGY